MFTFGDNDRVLWDLFFRKIFRVWIETPSGNYHAEFDNYDDFYLKIFSSQSRWNWDHTGCGKGNPYIKMYSYVNPVTSMYAAENKILSFKKPGEAVCDKDVFRYANLFVDIDSPKKPSTDKQLKVTYDRAMKVSDWFQEKLHFQAPMVAMSGNGHQLFFKCPPDWFTDIGNWKMKIKMILRDAFIRFSDDKAKVDKGTYSPSQRMKLWGTRVASSGRICVVLDLGNQSDLTEEQADLINETINRYYPDPTFKFHRSVKDALDVEDYLDRVGIDIIDIKEDTDGDGNKRFTYIIGYCPFNNKHGKNRDVSLIHIPSKYKNPTFQCKHDSCSGFKWADFKEATGGYEKD